MRKVNFFLYHMKAISFFRNDFGQTSDWIFSIGAKSVEGWGGGEQFCVALPALTKVCLSMIPLQLNLPRSDTSRCTRACQTLVPRDHASHRLTTEGAKPRSSQKRRGGERSPNWGASLQSQLVWLYSTGIFLPVRVWTTKPSAGADGYNFLGKQNGTGEFRLPKYKFFLISKSWFCYLRHR